MAKICFEIEVDTETGEVMAGVCPPGEESGAQDMEEDKSYLQPVGSVDEALATAKEALSQQTSPEESAMSEMKRGYMGKAMMKGGM